MPCTLLYIVYYYDSISIKIQRKVNKYDITIRRYLSLIPFCMDRVIEGDPKPHNMINKAAEFRQGGENHMLRYPETEPEQQKTAQTVSCRCLPTTILWRIQIFL